MVRRVLRDRAHIKGRPRKHVDGQVKKNVDGVLCAWCLIVGERYAGRLGWRLRLK